MTPYRTVLSDGTGIICVVEPARGNVLNVYSQAEYDEHRLRQLVGQYEHFKFTVFVGHPTDAATLKDMAKKADVRVDVSLERFVSRHVWFDGDRKVTFDTMRAREASAWLIERLLEAVCPHFEGISDLEGTGADIAGYLRRETVGSSLSELLGEGAFINREVHEQAGYGWTRTTVTVNPSVGDIFFRFALDGDWFYREVDATADPDGYLLFDVIYGILTGKWDVTVVDWHFEEELL
jgi:hypothetical protein